MTGTRQATPSWRSKSQIATPTSNIAAQASWMACKLVAPRSTSVPINVMLALFFRSLGFRRAVYLYVIELSPARIIVQRRYT
jgi:hypothetical protein